MKYKFKYSGCLISHLFVVIIIPTLCPNQMEIPCYWQTGPVYKESRWLCEGVESVDKCLEHNAYCEFGSQESVGELNWFVENVVFVNCHFERKRVLSHRDSHRCQTSYLSRRHPGRDFWACSDSCCGSDEARCFGAVFRRLHAADKLLLERKREYIAPFDVPFVASVIGAIHKSPRHCLSLRKLSAQIASICIYK